MNDLEEDKRLQKLYEEQYVYTRKQFDRTSNKHAIGGALFGLGFGIYFGALSMCGQYCPNTLFSPIYFLPIILIVIAFIVLSRF